MRRYLVFISSFLGFYLLNGQETYASNGDSYYIKGIVGRGSGNVKGVESNSMWGMGLGWSHDLHSSRQEWPKIVNAKAINVGFIYNNFQGMEVGGVTFGESYGVQSQVEIGLIEKENFNLRAVPGIGLGYMTKTTFTDETFYIFGTHINGLFTADLKANYRFNNHLGVFASIGFTHYSNGSFKIPNAGINTLNATLGLTYRPNPTKVSSKDSLITTKDEVKTNATEWIVGVGRRGRYKEHKGFFRMGFYGGYTHFFNSVLGIRAGIDAVYYDQVYDPKVYEDTIPYWGRSYDHWRWGLSVGGEAKMNKVGIVANLGYYLHLDSPTHQKLYWNTSVKYYLQPQWGVQIMLNAHKFQADFVNWGLFVRI